ncbi:hypothetical protein [Parablautia sp. Marseille-Q6255]|nr:hypothetical protein [Parablautia sp. Marseille-Q6255]
MIDVIITIAFAISAVIGICVIVPAAMIAWMWRRDRKSDEDIED